MIGASEGLPRLVGAAVVLLAALLGGCAATPYAGPADDNAAKEFHSADRRGIVYVYRHERFGAHQPMPLYLDAQFMGRTRGRTFFRWEVAPGEHVIRTGFEDGKTVRIDVRPGRIYYVWQEIRVGEDGLVSRLSRVGDHRGRRGVRQCALLVGTR